MKKQTISTLVLFLLMAAGAQAQNVNVEAGPYKADWQSLSSWECPEWFKDAKFGIWAHWGPQCEPEDGDWYARSMYYPNSSQYKYHVAHYGNPKDFGFKDVCNAWKAENWQPDSLIKLYKSVGARYFMALGQHHDNFDLWNSPYQEWNSVNVGPKKDLLRGWSNACKKYGLKMGVSMHGAHTWTWYEPSQDFDGNLTKADGYKPNADGSPKWWKGLDPQELYAQRHPRSEGRKDAGSVNRQWDWGSGASQPDEAFKMKFQNRVLECINDYQPDMIYFDDTVLPFWGCDESIGLNIVADYYNHSANRNGGKPNVVVMGKKLSASQKDAILWDVERGIPDRPQQKYWQTCSCLGDWHYNKTFYERNWYKSAQQVIDMLIDIVSKNGNLLLSVPVKGDGTIDDKEVKILKGIKKWMDVNSRSIYATRPWTIFGEGPLADAVAPLSAQGFNEKNNFSAKDVRYVHHADTVFATIMRWPEATKFTFKSLGYGSKFFPGSVKSVELLGRGPVNFSTDIDGVTVDVLPNTEQMIAPVYAFTFDTTNASQTLKGVITLYRNRISQMRKTEKARFDANKASFDEFARKLKQAKKSVKAGNDASMATLVELAEAYGKLQSK